MLLREIAESILRDRCEDHFAVNTKTVDISRRGGDTIRTSERKSTQMSNSKEANHG